MNRKASAHWEGTLKEGKGHITTQSTTLNKTQFSFKTRFEQGVGTNPEELIAAAHAGCFTMQVGATLTQAGLNPTSLDTEATLDFDMAVPAIKGIHLELTGKVPGLTNEKFQEIANGAKANCIISRAL
ncbi:MAG TPA: OsmC family protein, partial [Cyclobacteriaceae bacterium]|nr:OsmC family protein [Cyclobacteriaceae bacterium]